MNVDKPKRKKLKNIIKILKKKKREKHTPSIPQRVTATTTTPLVLKPTLKTLPESTEDLSIGINDMTNYAPPGYIVWNYYYDTPLQKYQMILILLHHL